MRCAELLKYRGRSRGKVQGCAFKICLPHRSVTSFLRGVPPPKKNPGSAPEVALINPLFCDAPAAEVPAAVVYRRSQCRLEVFCLLVNLRLNLEAILIEQKSGI